MTFGGGSRGSVCLETFLQSARSIFIRGRLSVCKSLRLCVLKEPTTEALAQGQNLPTEVNSKLMQLGEFSLKFGSLLLLSKYA